MGCCRGIAERRDFSPEKLQDKDWDGEIPETPSDAVRATRSEGILGAAAQGMQLSSACIPGAGRPSVRHLNSGTGLSDGKEAVNSLVDQGLLYAYILKKMRQLRAGERKQRARLRGGIYFAAADAGSGKSEKDAAGDFVASGS